MHPYAQRSPILIPVFLYRFNLLSNDVSVSVLNSVQASYFHKMNSLFLQPHRFLFISPIQGILSFYRQKVFFYVVMLFHAKPPIWTNRITLFFWVITFDLFEKGDQANSNVTAGITQDYFLTQPPPWFPSSDGNGETVPCVGYLYLPFSSFKFVL